MAIHTADAIILRQYPYRETSVLVSCLTDRYGKIKGMVKGLRGDRARFRSAMEPLTLNRIVFYDSRNSPLCLISQCELTGPFRELTEDLETIRSAALCAELADVVLEPGDQVGGIFPLVLSTLQRIVERRDRLIDIRMHFILRMLRLVGFQPQLDECAVCAAHPAGRGGYWSVREGGLVCSTCLHEDPRAEPISPVTLAILAACREAEQPVPVEPGEAALITRHLHEFLSWRLDRPLKSLGGAAAHRPPARPAGMRREVSIA